ncbi:uncharacterized protein LOC128740504 [Sabethes cyaneus]|uniref:uncharacterized protein LOC128740504 n=1 Tax=Sabethes cyaneus TaxID=53552 RepID=UPI00237DE353|nr:uncharacterized protein LOC128740504 [Sabethes cyaneus]
MDKNDYDSRVLNMINEGPYEECKFKNGKPKDPLNTMIDEANVVRQKVARLMGDEKLERRLYVPNPKVASLYCLPKIHKNPLSMRPISSNICTPTEKMAAWLVDEIKRYPVTHGKSVKNSIELVDQIKDLEIRRSEIMVSFDVASLFPSVPVEDALKSLRAHLERKQVPSNHIAAYLSVAQLCMKQNLFMFRGKFYKQNFGLSMGSKLSPLLAEVFMSDFETEVQKDKMFPRVWKRYVDDVFALVKERYLPQTLNLLNSKHDSIRFTVEKEQDGTLPFLDLRISIKEDKTLKFGIYRKPTSTDRFITSDSNHFGAQKQAAFHSMAHRLFNIPLEEEEFNAEREKIHKIAGQNGYDSNFVNKILRKHERKRHRQNATTLQPDSDEKVRISLPFYPIITNSIKNILHQHGFATAFKSSCTLREMLCNLKDKIPLEEQSGIYQIPCQDCPAIYIGQTRRKFKIRLREHRKAVEHSRSCDSSVAAHSEELRHKINWESAKLFKTIKKVSLLNAWESMYIANAEKPLMNGDDPPIISPLFGLAKK